MRRAAALLILLVLVACSSNPTNRWGQARLTLSTTQDTILIAHTAGLVDDQLIVAIDPVVQAARAALDKAAMFLPDGGSGFEAYMQIVEAMLIRLETMAAAGELNLSIAPVRTPLERVAYARARLEQFNGSG